LRLGAFVYAELSSQSSESGGQYVYLRDALHPLVAFGYGWSLLFVIQTGGMAAVALIFANHVLDWVGARVTVCARRSWLRAPGAC